jgi:hypothetical protein|uniref:Outer membrane protein beta-barrel domain-containing protein n=1 Tax=Desulfomonile tiedjei TaxID=2358 RepID=A0A7C4ES67_9BACT
MNNSHGFLVALIGALIASLLVPSAGMCAAPFGAPPPMQMGPGFGPPPGKAPLGMPGPFAFGPPPCPPHRPCPAFSLEGGGRGYYSGNTFVINQDGAQGIDFIRDLHFAQYTLVAEVYAALRVAPSFALTYTYMIPREDHGYGILPDNISVGNTVFTVNTPVYAKSTTSLHKLEGEYFLAVGPQFRAGAYLLGEFWVEDFLMKSALVQDSQQREEFLMGAGATGEFSPGSSIFVKFKGACTFLQKQAGLYLDAEGKFFPEMNSPYGAPQFKPYISAGYRFRSSEWSINEHRKVTASSQGPYLELGIIF